MKAVIYKGINNPLAIIDKEIPKANANELILKVKACGICGSDIHVAKSGYIQEDLILGHEFSGEVFDIGDGVEGWQEGDRALGIPIWYCGECDNCNAGDIFKCSTFKAIGIHIDGAYAEYVRVQAPTAVKIPASIDIELAVLYEPLSVAVGAYRRANVSVGDNVLILGGGAIGLSLALIVNNLGVNFVGLSEMQPTRLERAKQCGVNVVIDATKVTDPVAEFKQQTGKEPDVIFECVGIAGMFSKIIEMAPKYSTVVMAGTCLEPEEFNVAKAAEKYLTCMFHLGYEQPDIEYVIELLAMGKIDPSILITNRVNLQETPEMFEKLKQQNSECKVLIVP